MSSELFCNHSDFVWRHVGAYDKCWRSGQYLTCNGSSLACATSILSISPSDFQMQIAIPSPVEFSYFIQCKKFRVAIDLSGHGE